jgi:type IX secretion system PorP/SprF family membrane protein
MNEGMKLFTFSLKKTSLNSRAYRGLVLVISFFLLATTGYAQENPLFSQYMFNGLVINPAYTGSNESLTLTTTSRAQWTGLNGAPRTAVISIHSPIKLSRSAVGGLLVGDHIGVTSLYTAYGTYAYRIPVSEHAKIAVGAQAGVSYYKANLNDLTIVTPDGQPDPAFAQSVSKYLPNLGLGVYFYSKRTYVGISVPQVINNEWENQDAISKSRQARQFLLSAGHVFDLGPNIKLKPNVLLKWVEEDAFQFDLNANILLHELVWFGVSYRMNDSFDGLIQWNITPQFSLGYSYGYPTSDIAATQYGTHEVTLNLRVKHSRHIVFSPRYF